MHACIVAYVSATSSTATAKPSPAPTSLPTANCPSDPHGSEGAPLGLA
jgi:hypothetical protein